MVSCLILFTKVVICNALIETQFAIQSSLSVFIVFYDTFLIFCFRPIYITLDQICFNAGFNKLIYDNGCRSYWSYLNWQKYRASLKENLYEGEEPVFHCRTKVSSDTKLYYNYSYAVLLFLIVLYILCFKTSFSLHFCMQL